MVNNKSFFRIGIYDSQKEYVQNKIIIANYLLIFFFLMTIFFYIILFFYSPKLIFLPIISSVFLLLIALLNYTGLNICGRFILSLYPSILFLVFQGCIMQGTHMPPYGNATLMTSFLVMPFVLFDIREALLLTMTSLILGLSFILLPYTDDLFTIKIDPSFFYSTFYHYFTMINAIMFLVLSFVTLLRINQRSEQKNIVLANEAVNKNKALQAQQKEVRNTLEMLQHSQQDIKNQTWIIQGINKMNEVFQNNNESKDLYLIIIQELSRYLNVLQAKFYLCENKKFILRAQYALNTLDVNSLTGIVHDNILEELLNKQKGIMIENVPHEQQDINTGILNLKVNNIFCVPLIVNEHMIGAIELNFPKRIQKHEIDFINTVSENIALMIFNISTKKILPTPNN